MITGMLWFDNDPKSALDEKIGRAAAYYLKKYGCAPTVCYVHPSMLVASGNSADLASLSKDICLSGVAVKANRSVLPNHFWIGTNGTATLAPSNL